MIFSEFQLEHFPLPQNKPQGFVNAEYVMQASYVVPTIVAVCKYFEHFNFLSKEMCQ